MYVTEAKTTNMVVPYWNEIKNWNREDRSLLAELIEQSLTDGESPEGGVLAEGLSPDLMQELAAYAVKEHRLGHCLTTEQVKSSVMETLGWK